MHKLKILRRILINIRTFVISQNIGIRNILVEEGAIKQPLYEVANKIFQMTHRPKKLYNVY